MIYHVTFQTRCPSQKGYAKWHGLPWSAIKILISSMTPNYDNEWCSVICTRGGQR